MQATDNYRGFVSRIGGSSVVISEAGLMLGSGQLLNTSAGLWLGLARNPVSNAYLNTVLLQFEAVLPG